MAPPPTDRAIAERGVESRGVFPENPDCEEVGALADTAVDEVGCERIPYFEPAESLTDSEIRRLVALTAFDYFTASSTPCVFRNARSIANNLLPVAWRQPKTYQLLLERLLDMRAVLVARTERPYKLAFDTVTRQPLPREVLRYWPFSEHEQWTADLRAIRRGRAVVLEPIPITSPVEKIDNDPSGEVDLAAAMDEVERQLARMPAESGGLKEMPRIHAAVETLKALTLNHIGRQTGVPFQTTFSDNPLINNTEYLIYHSVFSVLLDRNGEPTTLGRLRYPILVPDPGSVMERQFPPPGQYVSVQKYGFATFHLERDRITKVLFGGIGALVENHGGGVRAPHEFQERIQLYMDRLGTAYAASVVNPAAFKPGELSVDALCRKFPQLVTATLPYTVKEIEKRAHALYENWHEVVKDVALEVLKEVVVQKIREKIIEYVVKKIGSKLIPLINLVSSAWDLFEGASEARRVRNIIGCILLHVKGSGPDDLHVAAKTLAQILAEKFEDLLLDALTKRAMQLSGKALQRRKPGDASAATADPTPGLDGDPAPPHGEPRRSGDAAADKATSGPVETTSPMVKPSLTATNDAGTARPATSATGTGNPAIAHTGTAVSDAAPTTGQRPHASSEDATTHPKSDRPVEATESETARPAKTEPAAGEEGDDSGAKVVAKKPDSTDVSDEPVPQHRRARPGDAKETSGPLSDRARGNSGRGRGRRPGRRGTGRRGTSNRSTPRRPRRRPNRAGAPGITEIAMRPGGIPFRMTMTPAARRKFDEIPVGDTVVYTIHNADGDVIYVGISDRKTDRTAVDRGYEHLTTKEGTFLGDAAEIRIQGHYDNEREAHALEHALIDDHKDTTIFNIDRTPWDTWLKGKPWLEHDKDFRPNWEDNTPDTNTNIRIEIDIDQGSPTTQPTPPPRNSPPAQPDPPKPPPHRTPPGRKR